MRNLWPFKFEVNLIQRTSFRERTMFVTILENGAMHWLDHSGRFGHGRGLGGVSFKDDTEQHFRGSRQLTPEEAEREKQEFRIDVQLTPAEFGPIQNLITVVGKPWFAGWEQSKSKRPHDLLAAVYWKHVNQFVYSPFDEQDA